jgi:hypothetical protein
LNRRQLPQLSRRDRWIVALLFTAAIGGALACPAAMRHFSSDNPHVSVTGVVAGRGVIPPGPKRMIPVRWYVMVEMENGERVRLLVDHATYMKLRPGVRVRREKNGSLLIVRE